jgi:hypothetical protein
LELRFNKNTSMMTSLDLTINTNTISLSFHKFILAFHK